jgi:hypothetical protein
MKGDGDTNQQFQWLVHFQFSVNQQFERREKASNIESHPYEKWI